MKNTGKQIFNFRTPDLGLIEPKPYRPFKIMRPETKIVGWVRFLSVARKRNPAFIALLNVP